MVFCTKCGNKLEEQWSACPICGTSIQPIIKPEPKIITSQQETITPYVPLAPSPYQTFEEKRTKKNKKKIAIDVFLVVVFFIGSISLGVILTNPALQDARDEANYWHSEYDGLTQEYNDLLDNYNSLFGDFQSIQDILYLAANPLINPDTPTYDEVVDFLEFDNTNSFNYTENFMCGDFAAMLMGRAKVLRNWRMRIACMFYSFGGDAGWEDPTDPYGSYGHAFNVILCQDYDGDGDDDWFYIEPQTDGKWVVIIGADWGVHYEIWLTFTGGIEGTMWSEPYYINHYSYFA